MSQKYTFFVHMNATKEWLKLARKERNDFFETIEKEILTNFPGITLRLFDVEAFSTRCSDIVMFESDDIQEYYFMMESLRDSKIYTVPYFEIIDIFPAIEDGFSSYETAQKNN